jgi:glutamine synthetase
MSATKVMKLMKDNGVKYVDMRFTDTIGKEQHVTIPASLVKADFFKDGKMFDGCPIPPLP